MSSLLSKISDLVVDHFTTPKTFKVGEDFEQYVNDTLFPPNYYQRVEKTHNYKTNNNGYVESSLNPDFKFRDRITNKEFYVEAKFRSGMFNGKIVWCKDYQLERYQAINQHTPVFLILGEGDSAIHPDHLSLIPMNKAKYTGLFPSYVDQFSIELDKPIKSVVLWDR